MEKKSASSVDVHVGRRVRMRRVMLGMSQGKLANGLGVTFQQVQKYEKGTNRISASRLHHISHILQVPEEFFFEAATGVKSEAVETPAYVMAFLATNIGLNLVKAFMQIRDEKLRQSIIILVERIADRAVQ
jgi:transcriptional regulator with XRE-family HTH domain